MKKIMIPTDFSDCSLDAAKTAVAMAKFFDAELHIFSRAFIHEYYDYLSESEKETMSYVLENKEKAEKQFDDFVKALDTGDLKVITSIGIGRIEPSIIDYVEKNNIDLIVIATHGVNGIKEFTIGSVTQKIVRMAPCPVLTVKQSLNPNNIKNIVFVSDFDPEVQLAFETCCELAKQLGSTIHFLNIDTPNYFTEIPIIQKKLMETFATLAEKQYGLDVKLYRRKAWNVENGLKKFLEDFSIDLAIIPTHGKKGFRYLFFNSIAEGIVNHLDFPILTTKI